MVCNLARMDTSPSEAQQIEMMIENLNAKYTIAIASKTFTRMEKLTKVGLNFDEAFAKEINTVGGSSNYSVNKSYSNRKHKADVHYVANAWLGQKSDHKKTDRSIFEMK